MSPQPQDGAYTAHEGEAADDNVHHDATTADAAPPSQLLTASTSSSSKTVTIVTPRSGADAAAAAQHSAGPTMAAAAGGDEQQQQGATVNGILKSDVAAEQQKKNDELGKTNSSKLMSAAKGTASSPRSGIVGGRAAAQQRPSSAPATANNSSASASSVPVSLIGHTSYRVEPIDLAFTPTRQVLYSNSMLANIAAMNGSPTSLGRGSSSGLPVAGRSAWLPDPSPTAVHQQHKRPQSSGGGGRSKQQQKPRWDGDDHMYENPYPGHKTGSPAAANYIGPAVPATATASGKESSAAAPTADAPATAARPFSYHTHHPNAAASSPTNNTRAAAGNGTDAVSLILGQSPIRGGLADVEAAPQEEGDQQHSVQHVQQQHPVTARGGGFNATASSASYFGSLTAATIASAEARGHGLQQLPPPTAEHGFTPHPQGGGTYASRLEVSRRQQQQHNQRPSSASAAAAALLGSRLMGATNARTRGASAGGARSRQYPTYTYQQQPLASSSASPLLVSTGPTAASLTAASASLSASAAAASFSASFGSTSQQQQHRTLGEKVRELQRDILHLQGARHPPMPAR